MGSGSCAFRGTSLTSMSLFPERLCPQAKDSMTFVGEKAPPPPPRRRRPTAVEGPRSARASRNQSGPRVTRKKVFQRVARRSVEDRVRYSAATWRWSGEPGCGAAAWRRRQEPVCGASTSRSWFRFLVSIVVSISALDLGSNSKLDREK